MKAFVALAACFISFQGTHAQSQAPLTVETVAKMDCNDVARSLQTRLALYQQLSQVFLQSNQTLESVYKTWGEKLAGLKDLGESARGGVF